MAGLFNDLAAQTDPYTSVANDKKVTRGTLMSFKYPSSLASPQNHIHDKNPLIIVTDVTPKYIRGVNLHYLDFHYVKKLLEVHGGKPSAQYSSQYIKGDPNVRGGKNIAGAFRSYFRDGIPLSSIKVLDIEFLKMVLTKVRSFSPNEIERIRKEVEAQIQQRLQARADELTSFETARKEAMNRSQNFRELSSSLYQGQQGLSSGVDQAMPRSPDVIPPATEGLGTEPI